MNNLVSSDNTHSDESNKSNSGTPSKGVSEREFQYPQRLRIPDWVRQIVLEALIQRDCPDGIIRCQICKTSIRETEPTNPIEIDHKDGNRVNWHLENLRFLCKRCNQAEFRREQREAIFLLRQQKQAHLPASSGGVVSVCDNVVGVGDSGLRDAIRRADASLQINRSTEPAWRRWVVGELIQQPEHLMQKDRLIASSAEACSLSIITANRHLTKMTSDEGILEVTTNSFGHEMIGIKPEAWEKMEAEWTTALTDKQGKKETSS